MVTERAERPPSPTPAVEVAVDDDGVEHGTAPVPVGQACSQPRLRLRVEDGQVVVELHPHQGDAAPAGRDDGVEDQPDRLIHGHSLRTRPLRRDAVHGRRALRDVAARVDQARPTDVDHAVDRVHESVRHRHVVEAVDSGRLEVEAEHLAGDPRTHDEEHDRGLSQVRGPFEVDGLPCTPTDPSAVGPLPSLSHGPFGLRPCPPLDLGGGAHVDRKCGRGGDDRESVGAGLREPAALLPRRRPGGTRPSARRYGNRSGHAGDGRRVPGADLPFGMIQWSPDTSPNAVQSGGGYAYGDTQDQRLQPHPSQRHGLSLVPGRARAADAWAPSARTPRTRPSRSRTSDEEAAPGRYGVALDPGPVSVAGSRSPPAPASPASRSPPGPGRTCSSRSRAASTRSPRPTCGSSGATSSSGRSRADSSAGRERTTPCISWPSSTTPSRRRAPGRARASSPDASSCSGPTCGAYVTFDPSTGRDVLMKVGISFVSTADARENLRAEDPGWSVASRERPCPPSVERAARAHRGLGRHRGATSHLLHRAVPLAPRSPTSCPT